MFRAENRDNLVLKLIQSDHPVGTAEHMIRRQFFVIEGSEPRQKEHTIIQFQGLRANCDTRNAARRKQVRRNRRTDVQQSVAFSCIAFIKKVRPMIAPRGL